MIDSPRLKDKKYFSQPIKKSLPKLLVFNGQGVGKSLFRNMLKEQYELQNIPFTYCGYLKEVEKNRDFNSFFLFIVQSL